MSEAYSAFTKTVNECERSGFSERILDHNLRDHGRLPPHPRCHQYNLPADRMLDKPRIRLNGKASRASGFAGQIAPIRAKLFIELSLTPIWTMPSMAAKTQGG